MRPADRSQQGFSLITVLALSLLLTIAVFSAFTMFRQESKFMVNAANRDRIESALDQGLEKALYQLNSPTGWTGTANTDYFDSITATATKFTDLDGYEYWVKVVNGSRTQPPNSTVNDTIANNLTITGDTTLNRSILVRAKSLKTNAELRAMAVVHRSAVSPIMQVGGITSSGAVDLGNAPGSSRNSCTGVTGCVGSVITGDPTIGHNGNSCLGQVTGAPPASTTFPSNVSPTSGTEKWWFGAVADGNNDYNAPGGSADYPISLTRNVTVVVHDVDLGGHKYIFTTNGFDLNIYVTGSWGAHGQPAWYMDEPDTAHLTGGHPSQCWVYVVGSGDVTVGGGTAFEMVMVAPDSAVTISGNGDFFGAVVSKTFDKNGFAGSFQFDDCILKKYKANTYSRPPIVTTSWSQF
jgi:hypothetical protein